MKIRSYILAIAGISLFQMHSSLFAEDLLFKYSKTVDILTVESKYLEIEKADGQVSIEFEQYYAADAEDVWNGQRAYDAVNKAVERLTKKRQKEINAFIKKNDKELQEIIEDIQKHGGSPGRAEQLTKEYLNDYKDKLKGIEIEFETEIPRALVIYANSLSAEKAFLKNYNISVALKISKQLFNFLTESIKAVGQGINLVAYAKAFNELYKLVKDVIKFAENEQAARKKVVKLIGEAETALNKLAKARGEKESAISKAWKKWQVPETKLKDQLEAYFAKLLKLEKQASVSSKALNSILTKQDELEKKAKDATNSEKVLAQLKLNEAKVRELLDKITELSAGPINEGRILYNEGMAMVKAMKAIKADKEVETEDDVKQLIDDLQGDAKSLEISFKTLITEAADTLSSLKGLVKQTKKLK